MGFSFYKSKKVGPFKINASSSGIGFSFGIKGARINFSPRGTFVNIGANGIYYRKKLFNNSNKVISKKTNSIEVDYIDTSDGREIGTVNFSGLTDIDSLSLVHEITSKRRKISLLKWFGIIPSIIIIFILLSTKEEKRVPKEEFQQIKLAKVISRGANIRREPNSKSDILYVANRGDNFLIDSVNGNWVLISHNSLDSINGYIHTSIIEVSDSTVVSQVLEEVITNKDNSNIIMIVLPLLAFWCLLLKYLDKKRKSVELYYAFDDLTEGLYKDLINGFIKLKRTKKVWNYTYSTSTNNRKYHAGASRLVKRKKIKSILLHKQPVSYFKTNIKIPSIILDHVELYFFPERILFNPDYS